MLENPLTEIPMALEVNYFQINRAEYFVPVTVKIPGNLLTAPAAPRGAPRTVLDFIAEVKDEYGVTHRNVRDRVDGRVAGITAADLATRQIQYETGFTLLPGHYVIKLLVRDAQTGRIGTYQTAFVIPNLVREQQRLPISSVVLASHFTPVGEALFNVRNSEAALATHPLVINGQKLIPSVSRVFSKSGNMHLYLQAYRRDTAMEQPLIVSVSYFQGDLKVFETEPYVMRYSRSNVAPILVTVPLGSMPEGQYNCQVTVLDPDGKRAAFWRAPIVVVE